MTSVAFDTSLVAGALDFAQQQGCPDWSEVELAWRRLGRHQWEPDSAAGHPNIHAPDAGQSDDSCTSVPSESRQQGLRLVPASTVAPEKVTWAWERRIPVGVVTLLVGQGGLGKSTLIAYLAAGWSRGTLLGDWDGRLVDVVIASAEEHRGAVIVPRLMAADADLRRVHFIESVVDGSAADIDLDGQVDELEQRLVASGARVLCIDTVVSHIPGNHDSYKEQAVRRVLSPLAHMAERLGIAVLGTMHLNRRDARDVLTRISGSGGFGNLARSILLLAPDPDDPEGPTRMLAHGKCNVGPKAPTQRVRVEGREVICDDDTLISTSRIVVIGDAPGVATAELLGPVEDSEARTALEEAQGFLRDVLGDGEVAARDVQRQARDAGIAERTLRRAREGLGVTSRREGFGAGVPSMWSLPTCPSDPLDVHVATWPSMARDGQVGDAADEALELVG